MENEHEEEYITKPPKRRTAHSNETVRPRDDRPVPRKKPRLIEQLPKRYDDTLTKEKPNRLKNRAMLQSVSKRMMM